MQIEPPGAGRESVPTNMESVFDLIFPHLDTRGKQALKVTCREARASHDRCLASLRVCDWTPRTEDTRVDGVGLAVRRLRERGCRPQASTRQTFFWGVGGGRAWRLLVEGTREQRGLGLGREDSMPS